MNRRWLLLTFAGLLSLSFSACMHGLMMGGHDEHVEPAPTAVRHEASSGPILLSVEIPPLKVGTGGRIQFFAYDAGSPIASQQIVWEVRALEGTEHAGHRSEPTPYEKNGNGGVVALEKGTGIVAWTPGSAGPHVLTAELTTESDTLRSVVTFNVQASHGGSMMGMGSGWAAPVVVVAVMGGLMLAMWAIRGGW